MLSLCPDILLQNIYYCKQEFYAEFKNEILVNSVMTAP